jgi:outer membrane biosynthesis protein TonB
MDRFESEKNTKAFTITGIVCGVLVFLLLVIAWTPPVNPVPETEDGMEVNLGNSETGLGDEPPLIPGPPADAPEEENIPPKSQEPVVTAETKEPETNDNDKEAPNVTVPKPVKPAPEKKTPPKEKAAPAKPTKTAPVAVQNPTPAPPKPKILYRGGTATGQGGNDADSWNNSRNQGVAGGKGDQGKPGGNPDSDNYNGSGGSGNGGVRISQGLGKRRITKLPSFQDEFSENAKVAVRIKVDQQGRVTEAVYEPRGSTASDASLRSIAISKARQLRFNPTEEGEETESGVIIFNFKVN